MDYGAYVTTLLRSLSFYAYNGYLRFTKARISILSLPHFYFTFASLLLHFPSLLLYFCFTI